MFDTESTGYNDYEYRFPYSTAHITPDDWHLRPDCPSIWQITTPEFQLEFCDISVTRYARSRMIKAERTVEDYTLGLRIHSRGDFPYPPDRFLDINPDTDPRTWSIFENGYHYTREFELWIQSALLNPEPWWDNYIQPLDSPTSAF